MRVACLITFLLLLHPAILAADSPVGVAIPYPVWKVDPLAIQDPVNRIILANIALPLAERSALSESQYELLSFLNSSDNGQTWRLSIKPELRFSSGVAADLVALKMSLEFLQQQALAYRSIKRSRGQPGFRLNQRLASLYPGGDQKLADHLLDSVPSYLERALYNIKRITIINADLSLHLPELPPQELIVELREADSEFKSTVMALPIIDAQTALRFGEDFGYGTNSSFLGPYYISVNQPTEGLRLSASTHFHRRSIPRTAQINVRYFPSAAQALSALRTAAVHIIALPTPDLLQAAKVDPTLQVLPSPLENLHSAQRGWTLPKTHWSDPKSSGDILLTNQIIVRSGVELDGEAMRSFNLSSSMLIGYHR